MFYRVIVLALLPILLLSSQNILKFGAIPNEDSYPAQQANAKAINQAILQANSSDSFGDARIVVIPNQKFYILPIKINNCQDIVV